MKSTLKEVCDYLVSRMCPLEVDEAECLGCLSSLPEELFPFEGEAFVLAFATLETFGRKALQPRMFALEQEILDGILAWLERNGGLPPPGKEGSRPTDCFSSGAQHQAWTPAFRKPPRRPPDNGGFDCKM